MGHLLFEFSIRALLIAMGTALLLRVLRVRTAAARHRVWTGVVVLMLLLPIWVAWGPRAVIHVLPSVASPGEVSAAGPVQSARNPIVRVATAKLEPNGPVVPNLRWSPQTLLAGIYLLGTTVLLVRLLFGTARAHLLMRRATMRNGQRTSAACVSPITVGWFHPVSILPERWTEWPELQLQAVLTHEIEHARRRDPLVQWLALFNRAIFWFHPLAWWLERQLSLLAEEACDAAVLADGHDPRDYSEYLMDLANSVMRAGRRVHVAGMSLPGSYLPSRIPRLFDGTATRQISRARVVCAFAACAISSTVFGAITLEPVQRHSEAISVDQGTPVVTPSARPDREPTLVAALVQNPAPAPQTTASAAEPKTAVQIESRFVAADRSFVQEILRRAGIESGARPPSPDAANIANWNRLMLVPVADVALLDDMITAAEANGTARLLGRPQIRTLNNTEATVSQGTQVPVMVNTNGVAAVSFLNVGLTMSVLPQIRDANTILMRMNLELTDKTQPANGVPAVSTQRSIVTEMLMANGTTSMVGGLTVDPEVFNVRQVPGLGAAPVVGTLFNGNRDAPRGTAELLIFITPTIKSVPVSQ